MPHHTNGGHNAEQLSMPKTSFLAAPVLLEGDLGLAGILKGLSFV